MLQSETGAPDRRVPVPPQWQCQLMLHDKRTRPNTGPSWNPLPFTFINNGAGSVSWVSSRPRFSSIPRQHLRHSRSPHYEPVFVLSFHHASSQSQLTVGRRIQGDNSLPLNSPFFFFFWPCKAQAQWNLLILSTLFIHPLSIGKRHCVGGWEAGEVEAQAQWARWRWWNGWQGERGGGRIQVQ